MATANPPAGASFGAGSTTTDRAHSHRIAHETKPSFKSSEFFTYLAAVVFVLIASQAVGTTSDHDDYFRADQAWLYIVVLTVGYMISRGLAKAGSRETSDSE
jgi:hypothetical protein